MATSDDIRTALLAQILSQAQGGVTEFREGADSATLLSPLDLLKALEKTTDPDVIAAGAGASTTRPPVFSPIC